jgi:hypothetical protein
VDEDSRGLLGVLCHGRAKPHQRTSASKLTAFLVDSASDSRHTIIGRQKLDLRSATSISGFLSLFLSLSFFSCLFILSPLLLLFLPSSLGDRAAQKPESLSYPSGMVLCEKKKKVEVTGGAGTKMTR